MSARVLAATFFAIANAIGTFALSAPVKVEDGYLSQTRYLSRYFGLAITFRKELNPTPTPVSQVQGSTRWLLGVQTLVDKTSSNILITATVATKKDTVSELRSDFTEMSEKPKSVTIGGQSFWKATVPHKPDPQQPQTVEYAGMVLDRVIKIRIMTSAGVVPDALTAAIEGASFLAPDAVAAARTSDMAEYEGPALPELGKPTDAIAKLDAGASDGRRYRNDVLGLDFVIPEGLKVHRDTELQREIESGHDRVWGDDRRAAFEHQVAQACTRPLLYAEGSAHPRDAHVSPIVMITAVDHLCMGGVRFPTSTANTGDINLVAQMLARQIRTAHSGSQMKGRVYSLEGHVMLNLSGLLYGTEPATGLRVPNHIRLVATELSGYWVIWTFIAPDTTVLDRLSNSSVRFFPGRDLNHPAPTSTHPGK
jgi:hypothetical protein